jgi:P4 family phage/plasmid primase-like protien
VVWPSANQDAGGAQYRWYGPDGPAAQRIPRIEDCTELPPAWVAGLAEGASPASAAAAPLSAGSDLLAVLAADDRQPCAEITNIHLNAAEELEAASAGSRHDVATPRVFALVMAGAFGHPGVGPALADLRVRWDALTAGEDRAGEFDRMALSAARKAVTEVCATGAGYPVAVDPCAMEFLVAPPSPGFAAPEDTDAEVLEVPAPAPVVAWSRRALIGTEAFDPAGLLDQILAVQARDRILPVLRYVTDAGGWLVRGPWAWSHHEKDHAGWAITELFDLMPDGDPDAEDGSPAALRSARRKRFGMASSSSGVATKLRDLIRAQGSPGTVALSDLDTDPEVLWAGRMPWNLRRCIERPALAAMSPDTPHLHSAGVAPSPLGIEHPTPRWDAFLAAVWPDAGVREWALHVLSVSLTGYSDAVMPVMWGETGLGKTSLVSLVMSVLGSYGTAADPRLLTSASENAHQSIIYALLGVRLAFIDEGPRDGKWATAQLKRLTGNSRLTGNPMRGNQVNFDPTHTLILTCNPEETPSFQDEALRRRLRLIPCEGDRQAVADTRAAITPAVWHREAPGVLAKLMHYTARWLADRDTAAQYRAPETVRWIAEDIARSEDPVAQWIDAEMEPCEEGTRASDLLLWYAQWLRQLHPRMSPPGPNLFGRRLSKLGYGPVKQHDGWYRPLRKRQTFYGPDIPRPNEPVSAPLPELPPMIVTTTKTADAEPKTDPSGGHTSADTEPNEPRTSADAGLSPVQPIATTHTGERPAPLVAEPGHERSNSRSELIDTEPVGDLVREPLSIHNPDQHPGMSASRVHEQIDHGTDPNPSRFRPENPSHDHQSSTSIYSSLFDLGTEGRKKSLLPPKSSHKIKGSSLQNPGSNRGLKPEPSQMISGVGDDLEQHGGTATRDGSVLPTMWDAPSLTEQSEAATTALAALRRQRDQISRLIKKTTDQDVLVILNGTRASLVEEITATQRRIRELTNTIKRLAAIEAAAGETLELPALKHRGQPSRSCSVEEGAELVRATMAARGGRVTADVESTGYPIGHPDHETRTLQLGDRERGTVWLLSDPVQFATCMILLAEAKEIEAYSVAVEISHLASLGLIDYQSGWARAHDAVIKAQLWNPVGTESHDDGLKDQSELHLPDPASPGAEAARSALFKSGGWLTDTKAKGEVGGGWVPIERSGWAQVHPGYRTMVDYAVSDVLDCAALGGALPTPPQPVYDRERAVQAAVGAVSYLGMRLDQEWIEQKIDYHLPLRAAAVADIRSMGIENPASSDQVASELIRRGAQVGSERGQIPLTEKTRKPSTKADILKNLPRTDDLAPLVDQVLEFRHHQRILSTYLGPYHLLCTAGDGRMRSTVYTLQADTGRFSCVRENLQNIPTHGGIRECIITDPDWLFVDADLAGVEVAVLAALSQDPVLLELVASGQKLHKIIAKQVYGPNYTPRQYGYVKNGVFAKLYGAGIWRIANTVGCSEPEAQKMVDALDAFAPGAKRWGYKLRNAAKAGMDSIELYSGRVLRLPAEFPHKIVNYYVQGTAREILVDGIIRWSQTRWGRTPRSLLVPVHDEILASVRAAEAPEAMPALGQCMATELYGVRIGADPKWKQPADRWLGSDHPLAKD